MASPHQIQKCGEELKDKIPNTNTSIWMAKMSSNSILEI